MGEYEERYPDAYGRDETAGQPPPEAELHLPPRQHRQSSLFRTRLGLGAAPETAPFGEHVAGRPGLIEPTAPARPAGTGYRGLGPRGYVRSDQRIYEDICDRLTEDPAIDASDIVVSVRDRIVTLAGSVDSLQALRQADVIAREAVGVADIRNDLIVVTDEGREPAPGDRAMAAADR